MKIWKYVNVGKMWKTPEKCGKLAKNVENVWKTCGNVENMWKTCGKHVGNSFVCANVQNCRQLYKRESIFCFFVCRCVSRYVCEWVSERVSEWVGEWVSAAVLFNCMLSHVGTERERRTCNEWLCTGVMRMVVLIYLKLDIFVYTSV